MFIYKPEPKKTYCMKKSMLILMATIVVLQAIRIVAQVDTTKVLILIDKDVYMKDAEGKVTKIEENIYELDLEQLLNLDLSSVLKKTQTIHETPAIVSIVTADQIRSLGAESIFDVLATVPGFTVQDSYWKRQMVTARGIMQTLYNDKILVLLNGIPTYDAAALEHYMDFIPTHAIQRIEIIRGPGSTLYGTNAFAAVINIITKEDNFGKNLETYLQGGSFFTTETGFLYLDKYKHGSFHLSGSLKNNEGYRKKDVPDNTNKVSDILYEHDNANIFASISYKSLTLQTGGMAQKWSKFGPMPRHIFGNNGDVMQGGRTWHNKVYVNGIFDKNLSENLNLRGTFNFDYSDQQADIGQFGERIYVNLLHLIDSSKAPDFYRFGGKLFGGSIQAMYGFSEKLSLIAGFAAEHRLTTHLADLYSDRNGDNLFQGSTREMPFGISDFGLYINADGKLGNHLGYVAGIRASYLGVSEKIYLTPRAGLVYMLGKESSIKLLYGEAFRGAGPQEQFYKVPVLIYGKDAINQALDPEKIKTMELALDQGIATHYKIRSNGFYNIITDIITRRRATEGELLTIDPSGNMTSTLVYDNLGSQHIYGFEIEALGYPTEKVSFWGNFSYKEGKFNTKSPITGADTTLNYIPFMEKVTANFGVSLKLGRINITPYYQFVGKREGYLGNNVSEIKTVDAYGLVNLNVSYRISHKIVVSIIGKNLTNKTYYYPETVRREILTIPGGPGVGVFGRVTFRL